MTIKKWHEVYSGSDERNFFIGKDGKSGLVRATEFDWRSTDALARESGLTKGRTEQIIDKYHKAGIVIQHSKDPEKWGYWEKVAPQLANQTTKSADDPSYLLRIDKATGKKK